MLVWACAATAADASSLKNTLTSLAFFCPPPLSSASLSRILRQPLTFSRYFSIEIPTQIERLCRNWGIPSPLLSANATIIDVAAAALFHFGTIATPTYDIIEISMYSSNWVLCLFCVCIRMYYILYYIQINSGKLRTLSCGCCRLQLEKHIDIPSHFHTRMRGRVGAIQCKDNMGQESEDRVSKLWHSRARSGQSKEKCIAPLHLFLLITFVTRLVRATTTSNSLIL